MRKKNSSLVRRDEFLKSAIDQRNRLFEKAEREYKAKDLKIHKNHEIYQRIVGNEIDEIFELLHSKISTLHNKIYKELTVVSAIRENAEFLKDIQEAYLEYVSPCRYGPWNNRTLAEYIKYKEKKQKKNRESRA